MAQPRTALAWLLREGSLILQAVCFLSGVPEQGCKAEACIPAAWGPADSNKHGRSSSRCPAQRLCPAGPAQPHAPLLDVAGAQAEA